MVRARVVRAAWSRMEQLREAARRVTSRRVMSRRVMSRHLALGAALLCAVPASIAHAQGPDPRGPARTIATPHFRVHFAPEHEALARRAAAYAEVAWTQFAAELAPPAVPVELLVGDNVDISNGFATPFPTNRITVFALPPHFVPELRHYDDWLQLVITHELAHIFHLDRATGLWALGRALFGRNPALIPNGYLPRWAVEGLAVHYEARFTGAGRLRSSEWPMLARAAAVEGRVPRLDEWSLTTSRFPLGQHAYGYGALLMTQLAARGDGQGMRRFVDAVASHPIPWRVDRNARRAFGTSFSEAARVLRDSLQALGDSANDAVARAADAGDTVPVWRAEGMTWFAAHPRWDGNEAVLLTVNDGFDVPGVYRARVPGAADASSAGVPSALPPTAFTFERLARRNSLDATTTAADGTRTFAQLDYEDPFTLRSRLWRADAEGRETPVAHTTRTFLPDARADGELIAVRASAGTTTLVRLARDGSERVLGTPHLDTAYTEPRWSPQGDRLVAVRLVRGGVQEVVLLDTLGTVTDVVRSARGLVVAPVFTADGTGLVWADDRSGALQLALGEARAGGGDAPRWLTRSRTGVSWPAVSPDGARIAALEYTVRGWQLVVLPLHAGWTESLRLPGAAMYAPVSRAVEVAPDTTPSTAYSPWRQLVPRWWMPVAGEGSDGAVTFGASSSGTDIRGRHAWVAQLTRHPSRGEMEGRGAWRYAALPRLGVWQPLADVSGSQGWDRFGVVDSAGAAVGELRRRARFATLAVTLARPRVRTSSALTLGAQLERRAFTTAPDSLLGGLDPVFARGLSYPSVFASATWSNTMRAGRAISPEDGVGVSATVQRRWRTDRPELASWRSTGVVRGYRAFGGANATPRALTDRGFARHVLGVRASGGVTDRNSGSEFALGGTSGTLVDLVPGVVLGDPARLFPVRGFAPGTQRGSRAIAASAEYRVPLAMPARGLGLVPLFLDRVSLAMFADAGRAWCGAAERAGPSGGVLCLPRGVRDGWLASAGAEVALDLGVQWDAPYRVRLGWARPVARPGDVPRGAGVFFTVGAAW